MHWPAGCPRILFWSALADHLCPGQIQGKRLVFVTNNATKSRAGYKKKFTSLGLDISPVSRTCNIVSRHPTCAWAAISCHNTWQQEVGMLGMKPENGVAGFTGRNIFIFVRSCCLPRGYQFSKRQEGAISYQCLGISRMLKPCTNLMIVHQMPPEWSNDRENSAERQVLIAEMLRIFIFGLHSSSLAVPAA